ncbi:hypothetical protein Droror1_Dr00011849 [Drosera rotundifolia]
MLKRVVGYAATQIRPSVSFSTISIHNESLYTTKNVIEAFAFVADQLMGFLLKIAQWEKGYYNASNTLLVDDSPYKALLNPPNTALFPVSYSFKDRRIDDSIGPGGIFALTWRSWRWLKMCKNTSGVIHSVRVHSLQHR